MDLKKLCDLSPWEWPEGTDEILLEALTDTKRSAADRLIAAELGGDFVVINEELASALLQIVGSDKESEELRGTAAIALGPVLEHADTNGFDDPEDMPISESMFHHITESLQRMYTDAKVPEEVRRRILEAAVRAPQDWQ